MPRMYRFFCTLMVEGDGFEPPNPKEQSYSLSRLASSLPLQTCKYYSILIELENQVIFLMDI